MKEIPGLTHEQLHWGLPWGVVLRYMADMPGQKYLTDEELEQKKIKKLTPQTSQDFKSFMDRLGAKQKE